MKKVGFKRCVPTWALFLRQDKLLARPGLNEESLPSGSFLKCAHLGSNQGPKDYESSTLTD